LPPGPDLEALAERLGYRFQDPSLLRQALAHRSWCAGFPGNASDERLEFLGDAVLGWVVADLVYRAHAGLAEGQLTDLRKAVVNAGALAQAALDIDLGDQLLLGKGEDAAGGRGKPSILSDAFEAVIGAVYLDGGSQAAYDLITRLVGPQLVDAGARIGGFDHKTALQELAARLLVNPPVYLVSEEGPDHAKKFHAVVRVDGRVLGEGEGRSKKQAEQAAAQVAREVLEGEQPVAHA